MAFPFISWGQTLGEKYQLPDEAGPLRTDGVYHLPASLLADSKTNVEAYLRFYPDSTFLIFHSRLSPKTKPENFQINCNYASISANSSPFNKEFSLKTKDNIARAKISYPEKFILLEMDIRQDVIGLTLKTFNKSGKKMGEPLTYVMPFYEIMWPVAKTVNR